MKKRSRHSTIPLALAIAVAVPMWASFTLFAPRALSQAAAESGGLPGDNPEDGALFMGLKPGAGRSMVVANCIPCHSTAIIAANHMNRQQWDRIITNMQEKNGMWPLPTTLRAQILDYLEAAQRVEDPGLDAGKQSPWAQPLYRPNPLW